MIFPFFLMLTVTIISAFGALFVKFGAKTFSVNPWKLITNKSLVAGGMMYFLGTVFYVWALQHLPLSVAYPLTSMTYIWVALLAKTFLKENVNSWRWSGIFLIVIGITLVAL